MATVSQPDAHLLRELTEHAGSLPIRTIEDDLRRFPRHIPDRVELVVCMVDTLLHLESATDVQLLFADVQEALEDGGRLILTFRDLTQRSSGLARFIPVRSDDNTILTCFLDYQSDAVLIHDLPYRRQDGEWHFSSSCYRKLRLSKEQLVNLLSAAGFTIPVREEGKGMINIVAQKS